MTRSGSAGDYTITYQVDGERHQVVVESADRISPDLQLTSLEFRNGVGSYEFTLSNRDRPPALEGRGILTAILSCEGDSRALNADIEQPTGWRLRVYPVEGGAGSCQFEAGLRGILDPGGVVTGLRLTSTLLPGISLVDAVGVSAGGNVTTGEDTPDSVVRLMAFASSKGVSFSAVTPSRPPESLSDPGNTVVALYADLAFTCDVAGWVEDRGLCRSLQAKIQSASAALGRGQQNTAKNQLSAFRAELDAQRGKHVNENAYFLLSVIADHALTLLR